MRAAGMLAGFGRRAFALSCWGLVSLAVLQVEPVRINDRTRAMEWEPELDPDQVREAVVYGKKWTHALKGTWWYFVVRATCTDESRHVCFLHVRTPAPSRLGKRKLFSSVSWAAIYGSTQMYLGSVGKQQIRAAKGSVAAAERQASGGGGHVVKTTNTVAQNFLQVLLDREPGTSSLGYSHTEALGEVFRVLCSKSGKELVTAVKEIGTKGGRSEIMNMKKLTPTRKGVKLSPVTEAVVTEIGKILEKYYDIDLEPQIMGHIPNMGHIPKGAKNAPHVPGVGILF